MSDGMAGLLGEYAVYIVAGWAFIELFAWLWEFVIFKRIMDDPLNGKLASAIAGYLTASLLLGLGRISASGSFDGSWFLKLLPAALIVGFFHVRRGRKLQSQGGQDLEETFR